MAKVTARWIEFDPATLKASGTALAVNINDTGTGATDIWSAEKVKNEIDLAIAGLDFQKDVIDVQVDNTLDPGSSPTTGDRYIITDASNLHSNFGTISGLENNDIVEYDGSAWVVAYDVSDKGEGVLTWVQAKDEYWRYDGTSWAFFGGLAGVTAGAGLTKTGNVLDVGQGNGIQVNADNIEVKPDTTTGGDVAPVSVTANGVGVDVTDLDGDHLVIDFSPNQYIPDDTIPEATDGGSLAAHLKGIDDELASLATSADTKQVKVSSNDTTEGYLEDKVVASSDSSVTVTTANDGSNETLEIQLENDSANPGTTSVYSTNDSGTKGWNSLSTLLTQAGEDTYTETITVTSTDITNGYIQLSYVITDAASVKVTPVGGPLQYNKAWGSATPDIQVLAANMDSAQVEIANVRTTGLSEAFQAGDVLVVEYKTNLQPPA